MNSEDGWLLVPKGSKVGRYGSPSSASCFCSVNKLYRLLKASKSTMRHVYTEFVEDFLAEH